MNYTPLSQQEIAATMLGEAASGRTASQIVAVLWEKHNLVITRNAVLGRLYRLGAPRNRSTGANNPRRWTSEDDSQAVSLAALKWSAKKIGESLGRSPDAVTRRMFSLGKPLSADPNRRKSNGGGGWRKRWVGNSSPKAKPIADGGPPPEKPASQMLSISDLASTVCHWPIGDPLEPDFGFCGAPKGQDDGPYCPYHHRLGLKCYESA